MQIDLFLPVYKVCSEGCQNMKLPPHSLGNHGIRNPLFVYYMWHSDSAPLAWIKTCRPPELDGLCISDLQKMSWALRMRWLLQKLNLTNLG